MMDNRGEILERAYRRKRLLMLGVCAALSGLAPVVMKVAANENVVFPHALGPGWGLSLVTRVAVFVAFLGIASLLARWNWVASDEVRRSHMLSFWAATGWSLPAIFFVFVLFGRDIPEASRLEVAFFAPMALGLLFMIARWLRDGYVW